MGDTDSTTYGVNFRSPLNNLKYFHVANSQLPQDVMHILLEGAVPYEMSLLLQHLISTRHFSEDLLNERIDCFHYSPDERRNKPSAIHLASSFHQSGERCAYVTISSKLLCMCLCV